MCGRLIPFGCPERQYIYTCINGENNVVKMQMGISEMKITYNNNLQFHTNLAVSKIARRTVRTVP